MCDGGGVKNWWETMKRFGRIDILVNNAGAIGSRVGKQD